jgi:8-oxo-dGTP pyrophosphatase MutT (NUDIX family)
MNIALNNNNNNNTNINNANINIYKKNSIIYTCTNCGKKNHDWKDCKEPTTSWGIILVNLNDFEKPNHDTLNNEKINLSDKKVSIKKEKDRMIVSKVFSNLQFLMISRKHSLGYIEFIRGRYKPHMIDPTTYLFRQMTECEIKKIDASQTMENGFDYLWKDLWGDRANNEYLVKEKAIAKKKYDTLKYVRENGPEISLDFIVKNVRPDYQIEEWGFPKGRRNRFESEQQCALREFKEESGYKDEDIKLIDTIIPLVEEFIGTNGVKYKHIYYVAELVTDKLPSANTTESQTKEIGNIGFFDFQTANQYIRDYHIERKMILQNVFMYYLDKILLKSHEQ